MTDFQSFGKWLEELEKSRLERERIEMARASELRQQDAQRMANDEERRRREGDQAAIAYHNRELVDPVASQTLGGGRLVVANGAGSSGPPLRNRTCHSPASAQCWVAELRS